MKPPLQMLAAGIAVLALFEISVPAAVNYDTAWTFVYDGGRDSASGDVYQDRFFDVKVLPDGEYICVGSTGFSNLLSLLIKLDVNGKIVQKKTYTTSNSYTRYNSQSAHSIAIAKNGDYIVGGIRFMGPWVMRLDSAGEIKWTTWYYDSTKQMQGNILSGSGTINCVRETKRGTIICAVGDEYPDNGGLALSNYAAFLEFTGEGIYSKGAQWDNPSGFKIGGFFVDEGSNGYYLLSGYQAVYYLDTNRTVVWRKNYTFSLLGVGTVTNNVSRVKMLRDGSLMVAGQAYEGNCWTNWQKFYYDAWHSPISYAYGANESWDTAGVQGRDDIIYDFTQLINGNLVFVGTRGDKNGPSPVWAFVTDSTGKQLLMDKQFCMPRPDGTCGNTFPFSVVATNDTGFTVAGKGTFDTTSGWNGFAAHFVPIPPVSVSRKSAERYTPPAVRVSVVRSRVVFNFPQPAKLPVILSIYTAAGKLVYSANCSINNGVNSVVWDYSKIGNGVYFYHGNLGVRSFSGKIVGGKATR